MARLWSCGFELNSKVTEVELDGATSGSTLSLETSIVRSGTYSIHGNTTGANAAQFTHDTSAAGVGVDVMFTRFYVYITRRPSDQAHLFSYTASGEQMLSVDMNTA